MSSNYLTLKTHTVILLVGPSGCGKSFFAKNYLIPEFQRVYAPLMQNTYRTCNIQYISSDDIRNEILGHNYNYGGDTYLLQSVSEQAFELLYKKVELVTSYPVSAEMVIVDTTGLNKMFRDKITKIAKANFYNTCCVVFNYKENFEYSKYLDASWSGWLINDHIKRLRREVLPELRKKDFDTYLYIKQKDFQDIKIGVDDAKEYASCYVPTIGDYPVVGDIHCDYTAFVEILFQLGFEIVDGSIVNSPNKLPIIIGDFIDKGTDLKKTVEFLYDNRDKFLFILGNHENFVYKYFNDELDIKSMPSQEFIDENFSSINIFKDDPELLEKFYELRRISKPFIKGLNFIATHAPCEEKYLGKLDTHSRREQRNYRIVHREENEDIKDYHHRIETGIDVLLKPSAARNKPFHIYGHVASSSVAKYKNKIGIDTGAGSGNRLSAALVVGNKVFYKSVPSSNPKGEVLPNIFGKKDASTEKLPEVDLSKLDDKELRRIKYSARDKINFISGTMSPSDKDEEKGTLESIAKAFEYYKVMGVDTVCLQPKYMGSRAEVFLHKDLSKCFSTTRKGYGIDKRVDLKAGYGKLYTRLSGYMAENDFEWLLIDAELMPWHVLGKGLIERQYLPVKTGIGLELELLENTGFEDKLNKLFKDKEDSDFIHLKNEMSKKDLREKLGHNIASNFEIIQGFTWIPLEKQNGYFEVYKEQLQLFASPSDEIEFKPFCLLKGGREDGSEQLFFDQKNSEMWGILTDDDCLVVDLSDLDEAIGLGEGFYQEVLARNLEGVVVKPDLAYIKGVAPFLKVRNPNYLSIIYGYDYLHENKFNKLIRQKRIRRKLEASIYEFEVGKRMLEIKRSEIHIQNKEYVSLFAKMIFEEKREASFDPRL